MKQLEEERQKKAEARAKAAAARQAERKELGYLDKFDVKTDLQ